MSAAGEICTEVTRFHAVVGRGPFGQASGVFRAQVHIAHDMRAHAGLTARRSCGHHLNPGKQTRERVRRRTEQHDVRRRHPHSHQHSERFVRTDFGRRASIPQTRTFRHSDKIQQLFRVHVSHVGQFRERLQFACSD